jgi:hypothetical protein
VHTCTRSMPAWQSPTEFSVTLSLSELNTEFFLCTPCTSADEGSTVSLLSFSEVNLPLSTHSLQDNVHCLHSKTQRRETIETYSILHQFTHSNQSDLRKRSDFIFFLSSSLLCNHFRALAPFSQSPTHVIMGRDQALDH